jgi:hypothetical protein
MLSMFSENNILTDAFHISNVDEITIIKNYIVITLFSLSL